MDRKDSTRNIIFKKSSIFTLTDLFAAIGILGIIIVIIWIVINPAKRIVQADNTARKNDVTAILDAIRKYSQNHDGKVPANMPGKGANAELIEGTGGADICAEISPKYTAEIPTDPSLDTPAVTDCSDRNYKTGYSVSVNKNATVIVSAPGAEAVNGVTPVISVSR